MSNPSNRKKPTPLDELADHSPQPQLRWGQKPKPPPEPTGCEINLDPSVQIVHEGDGKLPKPPSLLELKASAYAETVMDTVAEKRVSDHKKTQIERLVRQYLRRHVEALKIYKPMPFQETFHSNPAHIRLLRAGVRAGKTTAAAVEVARAVTGCDPHGKYPAKDGLCVIVNEYLRDVGSVTWRLLFRAGAFFMIRDERTGAWRAYNPDTDAHRKSERKPAPPLIPQRMIDGKPTWLNKGLRVFSNVRLKTGWEIRAFSSDSEPIQGVNVHLAHIDEDIHNPDWITELEARTAEVGGRIVWSARPHNRNTAMLEVSQRAWDQLGEDKPDVVEFRSSFTANPHVPHENKDRTKRGFASKGESTLRMFDEGEYPLNEFKVFPEFNINIHGFDADKFEKGVIPPTWTRFAAVDPGYAVCAVIFAAVPPPDEEDAVYLYDELYLKHCSAAMFAKAMDQKTSGVQFRAFIIDAHGSARSDTGVGKTIRRQYSEALEKRGVRSELTGSDFILGSDQRMARVETVHSWLAVRDDGSTKLRVLRGRLPMWEYEIERYFRKRRKDEVLEEPDDRPGRPTHLMHATQYLAHWPGLRYRKPKAIKKAGRWLTGYLKRKQDRRRQMEQPEHVIYMG